MVFIDTNYLIRFLIRDVESQYESAKKLFEKGLKEEIKLFSSVIVFFEIFWVFSSFYKKSKKEVVGILKKVLSLSFIDFENREILEKSLYMYVEKPIELEDCYNIVFSKMKKCKKFATFDKKIKKYL